MSATSKASKVGYFYKTFRVRRKDNGVTTVSMDPALATVACRALGGLEPLTTRVRELALMFDNEADKKALSNRSRYVATNLREDVDRRTQAARAAAAAAAVAA